MIYKQQQDYKGDNMSGLKGFMEKRMFGKKKKKSAKKKFFDIDSEDREKSTK